MGVCTGVCMDTECNLGQCLDGVHLQVLNNGRPKDPRKWAEVWPKPELITRLIWLIALLLEIMDLCWNLSSHAL